MLRYSLRGVLAAKGRLLLTAVAIVLGVGAVAGTLVLTDTVRVAAEAAYADPVPRVDVVVRAGAAGEGEVFSDITGELFAQPMPASALEEVLAVDGVAAATGVVSGDAHLLGRDGRVVGGGRAPLGRSVDPSFAKDLLDGRVPRGPGEVAIDGRTAREQRFGVGDRVRVVASGGEPATATVAGILDSAEIPDAVVLVGYDPDTARRLLAPGPGQVSWLEVHAAPGVAAGPLRDRVAAALGPGYQAFTEAELAAERARNATPTEGGDTQFFLVAGVVALFVGMFLIRNTIGIILASRTRELALLRCVGASRAQLRRAVLLQAAIVGALASLAGLAAGIGLASAFGALLRSSDEAIGGVTGGTVVLPRTVAVALAVGVGTALVSAWGPARRATRVAPVTALHAGLIAPGRVGRLRALAGVALALGGVALVLAGVLADPVDSGRLLAGAVAVALGVLTLGPALAWSLPRLLGAPIRRVGGVAGALAGGNAARNPGRTSATVLPLVVGLALVAFLSTLAAGTRASAAGGLERTLEADFRLAAVGAGMHQPLLSPRVAERLEGLPELAAVVAFQDTGASVAGRDVGLTAVDPARLGQVLSLRVTDGALADLGDGAIAVSREAAEGQGLAAGSPVTVQTPRGRRTLTVRAVYDSAGLDDLARQELPLSDYLVTPADYRALAGGDGLTMVLARRRPDVTGDAARAAIVAALRDHPTVEIASAGELRRRATAAIDPTLRLFYSLLGLAIVVGLFGVVNTLVLSVLERVRELGLLRAVGMDRRQLGSMVAWEAAIVAATGTVVGLALGAFLGWAVSRDLDLPATVPLGRLALVGAAAIAAGVLAAALPARRAARVDLVRAVAADGA
jgi:putative ABC transport system permease protein